MIKSRRLAERLVQASAHSIGNTSPTTCQILINMPSDQVYAPDIYRQLQLSPRSYALYVVKNIDFRFLNMPHIPLSVLAVADKARREEGEYCFCRLYKI